MNSSLHRLIVTTSSSFLYQLGHQLALALLRAKVLRVAFEPNKLFALSQLIRKNYFQTNAFPNLVLVEQEKYPHASQGKLLEEESRVK